MGEKPTTEQVEQARFYMVGKYHGPLGDHIATVFAAIDDLRQQVTRANERWNTRPAPPPPPVDPYWTRQDELREAGFTPYNCDELDEFPNMNRRR